MAYGKFTVLIGRDQMSGRLMLSYNIDCQQKNVCIGGNNSVPSGVSRCIPEQGIAHCSITSDSDGTMVLKNLKDQNVTCVDGMEVSSKRITEKSVIELGRVRYPISVSAILQMMGKVVPPPAPEFSILPLKIIWDDYHDEVLKMKVRQRKINLVRSSSGIFTGFGMILRCLNIAPVTTTTMMIIGGVVLVLSFVIGTKDKSIENGELLLEEFQDKYVCPNPKCRHFLGVQSYKLIRQNKCCPFCKAKWTGE